MAKEYLTIVKGRVVEVNVTLRDLARDNDWAFTAEDIDQIAKLETGEQYMAPPGVVIQRVIP